MDSAQIHSSIKKRSTVFTSVRTRVSYLFLISELVIDGRLLGGLDLDLLCGSPVRGVTVGQVAHPRVSKLGLFMSVDQRHTEAAHK